jgi:Ca2+-binding EF-hand superfamily protein
MVAGVLVQKADHWFKIVDVNGDGRIQRRDLQALGERILNHFGYSKDSAKGKKLLQAYNQAWEYMANAMDMDKNQEISQDEFRSYMAKHANRDGADRRLRPITDAEFAAADVNDDGYLSQAEYAELLRAWGLSGDEAEQGAANIDTNRDGKISPEEYFRACRDFFTGGNNLNDRAGQVFGRV